MKKKIVHISIAVCLPVGPKLLCVLILHVAFLW